MSIHAKNNLILASEEMIDFSINHLESSLLPTEWFKNTCETISSELFGTSTNTKLLDYGPIQGHENVRIQLADWLSNKYYQNLNVRKQLNIAHKIIPSQLFMTNGNTGALHLIISKYTESTNKILVDNPTDYNILEIFKEYGLSIEGVCTEKSGVNLEDLETKIINANSNEKYKPNLLFYYMVPTYHNPTGITISHEKRLKLAQLCNKYDNFYIIADESFHFITWSEKCEYYPMADYHPKIISLGSFSQLLAPGLRVGWIYQNTLLSNYNESYGFIHGNSSLLTSAILKSSGALNPIGFKFVEHALLKNSNGIRQIDLIINKYIETLKENCEMMTTYLKQFTHVDFIEPSGGYFLWVNLKTIKSVSDFAKYCEKNNVKIIPGYKFYSNKVEKPFIRLSFSYYDSTNIIIGLEKLMDCLHKYNRINVMILGSNGQFGSKIKHEIFSHPDINFIGEIGKNLSQAKFNELDPFNSVILDVSSNTGTYNLIKHLLDIKLYVSIIIGTTGLDSFTIELVNQYAQFAPVAHINNFSQGIPLVNQIAKITNCLNNEWKFNLTDIHCANTFDEPNTYSSTTKTIIEQIKRKVNINSVQIDKSISTQTLELTNGFETVTITHKVSDFTTYVKGCIGYIYWILTKSAGLYYSIDSEISYFTNDYQNQNIIVYELEKKLPDSVLNNLMGNIVATKPDTNKIALFAHTDDDEFSVSIYKPTQTQTKPKYINYCGYALMSVCKYILDTYDTTAGNIIVNKYAYGYTQTNNNLMIELPEVKYILNKDQDDEISELILRISNLTLFGVSRYVFNTEKYLILEMKENVFHSDFFETICAVICSDLSEYSNYRMIFINTSFYTGPNKNQVNMRCYDGLTQMEITDDTIGFSALMEYYLYHFVKNYKENKLVEINLINEQKANIIYTNYTTYLYEIQQKN